MGQESVQLGRIGVLMGGVSSERAISLKSGKAIVEALIRQGQEVIALDIKEDDQAASETLIRESKIDLAFIALHGGLGEDGSIQALLERMGIAYTGSGVEASRLAYDKALAQEIFHNGGLRTPTYAVVVRGDETDIGALVGRLGSFPVVIKPACEGSSIGIGIVSDEKELRAALDEAWRYGDKVLVEKCIRGRELTVGIVEEKPLPVVEILPKTGFFDYEAKYTAGKTEYIVPALLPQGVTGELQQKAAAAHRLLGCSDFSRVDFMMDGQNRYYILEVNTVPGFTATSLLPKAAQQAGIGFGDLCLTIARLAYGKEKKPKKENICL